MRLPPLLVALIGAALVLLVGTTLLRGSTVDRRSAPVASVDNGAPRGLLLLQLALTDAGRTVVVDDGTPTTAVQNDDVVVIVPPPEQSAFSAAEATALVERAEAGAVVVVACDGDAARNRRLQALTGQLGIGCAVDADSNDGNGGEEDSTVAGDIDGVQQLAVRDRGRVRLDETRAGLLPFTVVDDRGYALVAGAHVGRGDVIVLGSMSLWSNDGLGRADNAALLARIVGRRQTIVVDERHHASRLDAAVAKARLQGPGPMTALVCLLLLVPLTLLGQGPRRGVLVDDGTADDDAVGSGERVAGLAALLARAGARTATTPSTTTTRRGDEA